MADGSFATETVAGLIPIFVEKTITLPANTDNIIIDLSEYIPQGMAIWAFSTPMIYPYALPYYNGTSASTYIATFSATTVVINNKTSAWTNYTLRMIIYVK